jgi:hypothetical protein
MGMAPELCLGHLKIIPHKVGTPIVIMEPIFVGEGCAHLFGGFSFPDHGCEVLVAPLRENSRSPARIAHTHSARY